MNRFTQALGSAVVIGALALGGAATASAATTTKHKTRSHSSHKTTRKSTNSAQGGHVGANGQQEQLLTGDVAQKVGDAALAKVPGTLERVETDADHGSPYEAHIRASDGTEYEVLVNESFEVTAVNTMAGHCAPGGSGNTSGNYPTDSSTGSSSNN